MAKLDSHRNTSRDGYQDALECFDAALKIDPESVRSLNGKGQALMNLGRYEESSKSFDEAIASSSEDPEASAEAWYDKGITLYNWGVTSSDSSKFEEALKSFEKAIEAITSNSSNCLSISSAVWSAKSQCLEALGREKEAREALNKHDEIIARRSC
jgi:tetratricopeptide (TPR) repeat protein